MIQDYLTQNESKTLEFKENAKNLSGIVKTIIAFANTAGGILLVGVKDKTKEIIGVSDALYEEERIANAISDSVAPLIIPDIEIHTHRDRELVVIRVPHAAGPFYLKTEGEKQGVYIRFGSANRIINERSKSRQIASWEETILIHLESYPSITTKEASKIWKVSDRTARTRLKAMVELGRLQRIATSEKDPFAMFVARK